MQGGMGGGRGTGTGRERGLGSDRDSGPDKCGSRETGRERGTGIGTDRSPGKARDRATSSGTGAGRDRTRSRERRRIPPPTTQNLLTPPSAALRGGSRGRWHPPDPTTPTLLTPPSSALRGGSRGRWHPPDPTTPTLLTHPSSALTWTLLFISASAPFAAGGNPYCDGNPQWFSNGIQAGGKSWSSYSKLSRFEAGPCLGVSGIGVAQTQYKKVLIIDRSDFDNTYLKLDGQWLAYAEELSLETGQQRPLNVLTNAFCSTGQFMADGTFLSIGGAGGNGYSSGGFTVRAYFPCNDSTCDFTKAGDMTSPRWYPTSQLMPDGRLMIVGGSYVGVDLNRVAANNPTLEYFPRQPGEKKFPLPFLGTWTMPYNLYPFVHLLPSGRVFIFAANRYTLWDTNLNTEIKSRRPVLTVTDNAGNQVMRSYPLAATSVLFPLMPIGNYTAEIMICGGNSVQAKLLPGKKGQEWTTADNQCYRIQPEVGDPQWVVESMKTRRVMPTAVLLPDSNILIINGAQTGYASIPNYAHMPALQPEMYQTEKHKWYPAPLASSRVPRVYHGTALLLHDATVFVSGSNPNNGIVLGRRDFPTEFRSEIFYPPYYYGVGSMPRLTYAPASVAINTGFFVRFKGPRGLVKSRLRVVLNQPGFSTHGANHGQRGIVLYVTALNGNGPYQAYVRSPPNKNICPPTFYWLFVLVDGRPNREGHAIFVS